MSNKYKDQNGTIHDVANNYKFSNVMQNYSSNEEICGTWIDGKPLYRKVITALTPTDTNSTVIANYNANVEAIIRCEGYIKDNNGSWIRYLPINYYYDATYSIATYYRSDNGTVNMKVSNSAYFSKSVIIILEYTKTTD